MENIKKKNQYLKGTVFIICLAYFIICIFSIFKYGNSTLLGSMTEPNNDDVKFIRSAWLLKETGKYVYHYPPASTVFMMPGLSFTLAFFMSIFGKFGGITALRVFQAILQTGSLYITYKIAEKIFSRKVGIVALIISLLYIPDYWVPNLILTESIFKFFLVCLIYFAIYAIETKQMKYYIMAGVSFGFSALFRPAIALFPIVILIMWIIYKYKFKDMLKYAVLVSAIFCLILSPWWIRNYVRFDRFIPFTLATGNPMLQGTYINYDQSTQKTDGLNYNKYPYPKEPSEMGNNRTEMNIAKYRIRELMPKEPAKYIRWYTVGKTKKQIEDPFIWKDGFLGVKSQLNIKWHHFLINLSFVGIIIFYINKQKNKMGNLLVASIIYFILAYLPFFCMSRYFYPIMGMVMIFAAYCIVIIWDTIKLVYNIMKKIAFA